MKRLVTAVALGSLVTLPLTALAQDSVDLDSNQSKLSYSIGATLGQGLSQDIQDLDVDAFAAAIRDVYGDNDLQLSQDEISSTLTQYQQQKMQEQKAQREQVAEDNRANSEAFLAENAEKDGVETTDSGLQYEVLESGDGASPSGDDTVRVNYEGTLPDGTVFDSSYERGEPISFQVDQVIPGWQEALQMMHVGDTWKVTVPSDLAYGPAGTGGPIGPNQALQFKIELLGINPDDSGNDSDS
ncbi:FKBP-type peptidyl-prolyl cis-trans isomerase [Salinicola avicenniae]|uniref:FKBP-type peptidyl-prolyl cis-trans isomerase n=1 Tax=Salinicola avicenniae TaxID=2916836 RepID=UPI002072B9C0|nr:MULTISPECIES: FKBP-type peptidyl-prolyl cis-trans isomerase [unclassified Salinicola]